MKTILRPLPKEILNQDCGPYGVQVCMATSGEKPVGAIYTLHNGSYEAVPYDNPNIKRFDDPHQAQKHIEDVLNL